MSSGAYTEEPPERRQFRQTVGASDPGVPADAQFAVVLPGGTMHILVTDEVAERALDAAEDKLSDPNDHIGPYEMRAALNAVAGDLWQAGYDAAIKLKLKRL